MSGPVAEPKPTIRENVQEVETGQVRVGGIALREVIRVGASRTTPTGRTKWRIYYRLNLAGMKWDIGPELYGKTIAARWPDVEE
jgi:hypothetical protein